MAGPSLKDAADILGVSEMTVRRDIAANAEYFAYLGGHTMSAAQIEGNALYELATAGDSHTREKEGPFVCGQTNSAR